MFRIKLLAGLLLAAGSCSLIEAADTPPIKRTILKRADVPDSTYEVVYLLAEIAAGSHLGRHTHPGKAFGYLLEGSCTVLIDGNAPMDIKPGDAWEVAAGTVHDERAGTGGARILAVYTVEKGKPITTAVK